MEIQDIIAQEQEKLYGFSTVVLLSGESVSDYERGVIAGKIQMINSIIQDLSREDEDEDNII